MVAERDRRAGGAGAGGAADSVDIAFRLVGHVVIDDVGDAVDVDAAGGDVGGDEHADLAVAERGEHALALRLRLVAVERLRGDTATWRAFARAYRRRAWCG